MRKIVNISMPGNMLEELDKTVESQNYASRSEFLRDLLRNHIRQKPDKLNTKQIIQKARPVLNKHNVKKASLFGSAVRGELTSESDIDFLVELPKGSSLFDLINLEDDLKDVFDRDVDVVTFNGLNPKIKDNILNSQKKIKI